MCLCVSEQQQPNVMLYTVERIEIRKLKFKRSSHRIPDTRIAKLSSSLEQNERSWRHVLSIILKPLFFTSPGAVESRPFLRRAFLMGGVTRWSGTVRCTVVLSSSLM